MKRAAHRAKPRGSSGIDYLLPAWLAHYLSGKPHNGCMGRLPWSVGAPSSERSADIEFSSARVHITRRAKTENGNSG
jgi:hypothetical protein